MESESKAVLSELLYANNLVLMSKTIERLMKYEKWKTDFESKGL